MMLNNRDKIWEMYAQASSHWLSKNCDYINFHGSVYHTLKYVNWPIESIITYAASDRELYMTALRPSSSPSQECLIESPEW